MPKKYVRWEPIVFRNANPNWEPAILKNVRAHPFTGGVYGNIQRKSNNFAFINRYRSAPARTISPLGKNILRLGKTGLKYGLAPFAAGYGAAKGYRKGKAMKKQPSYEVKPISRLESWRKSEFLKKKGIADYSKPFVPEKENDSYKPTSQPRIDFSVSKEPKVSAYQKILERPKPATYALNVESEQYELSKLKKQGVIK